MAKKGKREDAFNGATRKHRRAKTQLVTEGVSSQKRAGALIRLRELRRHYDEVGERLKAATPDAVITWSDPAGPSREYPAHLDVSQFSGELQTDWLDYAATKQAIRELAAAVGVRPLDDDDYENTLTLIGEALDGGHRRGNRR